MANSTTTAQLVQIRDKIIEAINKIAADPVSSYTIGDQTFSLVDIEKLENMRNKYDRMIAAKDGTMAGRNRMNFANFNG